MLLLHTLRRRIAQPWRHNLLVATAFLIPWQAILILRTVRFHDVPSPYYTIGIFAIDVLMMLGILANRPSVRWYGKHWILSPLFLIAYAAALALLSADPVLSLATLATLVLLTVFGVTLWQKADRRAIESAVILSAVLQSLIAVFEVAWQVVPGSTLFGMSQQLPSTLGASVVETSSLRFLRAYGMFPHPNVLGGFLALGILLAVNRYVVAYEEFSAWWNIYGIKTREAWKTSQVKESGKKIAMNLAAMTLMLAALFVTFSRGALLSCLTAVVVYFVLKHRNECLIAKVLAAKLAFMAMLVATLWLVLFPDVFLTRYTGTGRLETQSITERVDSIENSWSTIQANPIFGIGLGNLPVSPIEAPDAISFATLQPPHNMFVLFFLQIGIVGLFVLAAIVAPALKKLLWVPWRPLPIAILTLLFVIGLLDHYLWSLHPGLLIGTIALVLMKRS